MEGALKFFYPTLAAVQSKLTVFTNKDEVTNIHPAQIKFVRVNPFPTLTKHYIPKKGDASPDPIRHELDLSVNKLLSKGSNPGSRWLGGRIAH